MKWDKENGFRFDYILAFIFFQKYWKGYSYDNQAVASCRAYINVHSICGDIMVFWTNRQDYFNQGQSVIRPVRFYISPTVHSVILESWVLGRIFHCLEKNRKRISIIGMLKDLETPHHWILNRENLSICHDTITWQRRMIGIKLHFQREHQLIILNLVPEVEWRKILHRSSR